jgi:hypothetical protein
MCRLWSALGQVNVWDEWAQHQEDADNIRICTESGGASGVEGATVVGD